MIKIGERLYVTTVSRNSIEIILLFLTCLAIVFIFKSNGLVEDNFNYAIEEIHTYDSSIFNDNINTVGSNYSPRLYANYFMSFLMKILGSSWYGAALVLIRFNYLLYAIAITAFSARLFEENRLLIGCILTIVFMGEAVPCLSFGINGANDVFLGTAIPIALVSLAVITGKKKKWNLAWILLSISEFMHVHEGIWAGCIAFILFICFCISNKNFEWRKLATFPIYVLSVAMVVLPSLLHSEYVDDKLFNKIYVLIRTPHHLLLSYWGITSIVLATLFVIVPFALIFYNNFSSKKVNAYAANEVCAAASILVLWFLLLMVEYLFTEIIPISTIPTMYLPKCLKYISYLGAVVIVKYSSDYINQGKYIKAISLLAIILFPYDLERISYLVLCVAVLLFLLCSGFDIDKRLFVDDASKLDSMGLLVYLLILVSLYFRTKLMDLDVSWLPLIFSLVVVYEFLLQYLKYKKLIKIALIFSMIITTLVTSNGFIFNASKDQIRIVTGTEYVKSTTGNSLYSLANLYKELTLKDAMFLADPDSTYSNMFQLVSQRSCYCVYKNTPSTKSSVIEWYNRIEKTRMAMNYSPDKLAKYMRTIDVDYILIPSDRFFIIDQSGLFKTVVKDDSMGMYRLR